MDGKEIINTVFHDIRQRIIQAALNKEPLILGKEDVQAVATIITEHAIFRERLKAAHDVFLEPGRHDKRASDAIKKLGFSVGHRTSKINHEFVYWEYLDLILGGFDWDAFKTIPAIPKKDAVEKIQEKYDLNSYDASYKMLQRIIKEKGQSGQRLLPANWPSPKDELDDK